MLILICLFLLALVCGTVWWHRQIWEENERLGTSAAQDLGNEIKRLVRKALKR